MLTKVFKNLINNTTIGLCVCLIATIAIEMLIFNADNFLLFSKNYPRIEIPLPFNQTVGRTAVILNKDNNQLVVNLDNVNMDSVTIETHGNNQYVTGKIKLSDDNYAYRLFDVNTFAVNPGGKNNIVTVKAIGLGKVKRLGISFDNMINPITITKIIINNSTHLNISFIRIAVTFIILGFIYFAVFRNVFTIEYDELSRKHKAVHYAIVGVICLLSIFLTTGYFGSNTNPIIYNYYAGAGAFPMTNPEHSILVKIPETPEEIKNFADPYVKQMDAFNKGQINIDYPVDPRLYQLDNMFDYSERMAKNIYGLYDLSLYNQQWHSYFGIAPLALYYPIYLLTGKAPALPFASGILPVITILSISFTFAYLFIFFKLKTSIGA